MRTSSPRSQSLILLVAHVCLACLFTGAAAGDDPSLEAMDLDQAVREQGARRVGEKLEKLLEDNPANDLAFERLHALVAGPYGLERSENLRLRGVLRQRALRATAVLISSSEPGVPLVVSGTVRDGNGRPIAGVLVEVFHADTKGEYTRERAMDEPMSRLFGFMRTGADGRYEFHTIRPGGYAHAPIPQHIHLLARATGYEAHLCRSTCQLVFADDPRMTPEWLAWAKEDGNPVLVVTTAPDGMQRGTYDFVLDTQ